MSLFRVTLDGNLLANEPEGLMDFVSELKRDKEIGGQVLLVDLTIKFKDGTDGYAHLKPLIDCQGFCAFSEIVIEEDCNSNGTWVEIFDGLIFYTEVKEDLFECILECQLTDNSFFAKIDNNKNIEAYINVGRSKNDVSFTANTWGTRVFDVSSGIYTTQVAVWRIDMAFEFIINYMTDGEMDFVSDYFQLQTPVTTDGQNLCITTGEQLRLGSGGGPTIVPFFSFQTLFQEVNKVIPISFSIETIAGVKTMRVEPRSYFFNTGISTTLNNVKGIVKSVNTSELYSRVKLGGETIEYVAGQTDFPTDIRFAGFKEESYTITGKCNIDNTLDLTSEWIKDSNIIQDVVTNGNTGYDENIFFLMIDNDVAGNDAIQTDVFDTGAPPVFYNDFLRNANVAQRWLGGIPNSIALYLGNGNDEFRASVNPEVTHNIPFNTTPVFIEPLEFQDDFTTPNHDVNGNYNIVTYSYTIPATGLYTFETKVVWKEGPVDNGSFSVGIRAGMFLTIRTPLQDYESTFTASGGQCLSIVTVTGYFQTGDDIHVLLRKAFYLPIPGSFPFTAQKPDSYFTCLSSSNGGGVFQTYNPEDFKAYKYEIKNYPLTFSQYQTIIANPLKLLAASDGTVTRDGWIENMKYHHIKGTADFVLSKSLPKTVCE